MRAPKERDSYKHLILSITSQSLKFNEKWLMTKYIAVLRHQYTLYVVYIVADLAII